MIKTFTEEILTQPHLSNPRSGKAPTLTERRDIWPYKEHIYTFKKIYYNQTKQNNEINCKKKKGGVLEFLIKPGFMIVNQFSKTSPSFQADSITISFPPPPPPPPRPNQHPTSLPSQHHNLTPDLKWAMVNIFVLILR